MNRYDSSLEQTYSGNVSVYIRRIPQDRYNGIIDNCKSNASIKVTQENFQVDDAFDMDQLVRSLVNR